MTADLKLPVSCTRVSVSIRCSPGPASLVSGLGLLNTYVQGTAEWEWGAPHVTCRRLKTKGACTIERSQARFPSARIPSWRLCGLGPLLSELRNLGLGSELRGLKGLPVADTGRISRACASKAGRLWPDHITSLDLRYVTCEHNIGSSSEIRWFSGPRSVFLLRDLYEFTPRDSSLLERSQASTRQNEWVLWDLTHRRCPINACLMT